MSVNGSSPDGKCSSTSRYNNSYSTCEAPTSSVLFDSTLTGLDGDMWASQLLTLQIHNPRGQFLVSDFNGISNYVRVGRVELTMFNCPEWGIAVQVIGIWRASSISGARVLAGSLFPAITSCDSLVRVCTSSLDITTPVIVLQFIPATGSNRIYLAEVEFYGDSSVCPPDTIITTPPPDTTAPPPPDTTAPPPPDTTIPDTTQEIASGERETPSASPSCTTSTALASVITAIATALLATVISVLATIAVCKCHPKFTPGGAETATSAGGEGQEYEEVDGGKGGVAGSDPTYMEVEDRKGVTRTFQLKKNEAYATTTHK